MQQTNLNIDELLVNSKYATNAQVLQLLTQVRRDIKVDDKKKSSDII
jgi:UDP-N-acetylenolpyruvoylglucosamine reductase